MTRPSERGSILALTAIFLLVVVVAILVLLDGMRLYRVRSLLQVATDAACQDAAVSAPDYEHYKETGETLVLLVIRQLDKNGYERDNWEKEKGDSQ